MHKLVVTADKKNYIRAVLTDTIPYETPIIFSNDGFYLNIKKYEGCENEFHQQIVNHILFPKNSINKATKPYLYKINKGGGSLRTLALIHPSNQVLYAKFYDKYGGLITNYCRESKTSLRSPYKVGNTYYLSSGVSSIDKYRKGEIDTLAEDLLGRYSTSYFSYNGYKRLHKFYNSVEYLRLEQNYPLMKCMDISRCFDTIYTHSISWATKNKKFSKENTHANIFGNEFDTLIQKSNYNETNGIPIGAEISRIFAEIVLNGVDSAVISILSNKGISFEKDYVIRRYVDDYFIFSKDNKTQELVSGVLVDRLSKYKQNINVSKTEDYQRPFYTSRSAAMVKLSDILKDFSSSITAREGAEGHYGKLKPIRIRKAPGAISNFIKRAKGICRNYNLGFDALSSYIISSIFSKIQLLIEGFDNKESRESDSLYKSCFYVLLDTAFFFYGVAPTVTSSYSLSKILILTIRFFTTELPEDSEFIKQLIYEKCLLILKSRESSAPIFINNHIKLEKINILLAMEELGKDHLLPAEFLKDTAFNFENIGYFEIVSLLYYIKNDSQYAHIKKKIYLRLKDILNQCEQVNFKSSHAHLFLDIVSCPYINEVFRLQLLRHYRKKCDLSTLNVEDEEKQAKFFYNNTWFVSWHQVDLYKSIEKKELKMAY